MILYAADLRTFTDDTLRNQTADRMRDAFERHYGMRVSPSEFTSWQNSLQHVKNVVQLASLPADCHLALEYELPYTQRSRIDCLLFGHSTDGNANTVLIELKQWTQVDATEDPGNFVETYLGGMRRHAPHPSQQVQGYHDHLMGFVDAFAGGTVGLTSCAYCHNYSRTAGPDAGLLDPRYGALLKEHPLYAKEDAEGLADLLERRLAAGGGGDIFSRVATSPVAPSKKLLDFAAQVIDGEKVYALIDDQITAMNAIVSKATKALQCKQDCAILVEGGPGTGKTLVALKALGELARRGCKVMFATKSSPLRTAVEQRLGRRVRDLVSNLMTYSPHKHPEKGLDVLLVDEAHRIEKQNWFHLTPARQRDPMPTVNQLLRAAHVVVFFIDDHQNARPREIGSSKLISDAAGGSGIPVQRVQLTSQFRCGGSDNYLNWVNALLGHGGDRFTFVPDERFDFRICDSPEAMYRAIREHDRMKPGSARLTAGYCWPWSDPKPDGTLVDDVCIGSFRIPWEGREGKFLAPGIPKWNEWAFAPGGINQCGCIYTAQGFEFEYIGVIVGDDLKCPQGLKRLTGDPTASKDTTISRGGAEAEKHIRNIYRVLLTRGMKGCYVYFADKATERFVRSLLKEAVRDVSPTIRPGGAPSRTANQPPAEVEALQNADQMPFRVLPAEEVQPFANSVPVYDLRVAAGGFGTAQAIDEVVLNGRSPDAASFQWAELPPPFRPRPGMFVTRVLGESMNRCIPDGSWCLFRAPPVGSRDGRVLVVRLADVLDDESGGHYTLKVYQSRKTAGTDGTWEHAEISLHPDTTAPGHEPIVLGPEQAGHLRIVGEFVAVLRADDRPNPPPFPLLPAISVPAILPTPPAPPRPQAGARPRTATTSVVLQPCANKLAQEHLRDTILHPVPLRRIREHVLPQEYDRLARLYTNSCAVWGVEEGLSGRTVTHWGNIEPGDIALFAKEGRIFLSGRITLTLNSPALARALWGESDRVKGRTWQYIYFLDRVSPQDIPYEVLNEIIGYHPEKRVQGFMRLQAEKGRGLLDRVRF